ncbi:lipoprotein [Spiroplasma diminutum]|uniref:Lipoprotein n=1 Tax=Spiroplasma diminutum CUAS-1 TaxID=1276221 RepID=S5M0I1_9MOLU|nr:lipoprotein [Spiroplasma diminutum]AGR42361.1 hypothetical protein SDIMI_v3c06570 [Spiroplasma diminutum CUAS-1]
MKKLLTLLGSVSLVATTAQMAVACGTNYDKKDEYGNSILIEFLQSIDGTASISSSDILFKLINNKNGPQNKEKLTLDLLKMINLSILANTTSENNNIDESIYTNYDLANILSERWKSLNATVDRQITTEKDKYKKDYGKKWEKKWKEMLVEKYSVYQDDVKSMDLNFLENKYKANILLTDSNNSASKTLLDVLLNTNQQGVTWIGVNDIVKKHKALKNIVDSNDDTKIANYVKADLDQIAQIENSTKAEASDWKATTLTETSSTQDLVAAAKKAVEITTDKIINDTPVNLNNFTLNDTNNSRAGFLSNSQKYFLDKFYTTQAPLAISEVVIPFSENGSFDNGVTVNSFKSNDGIDQKNTNQLLKDIQDDVDGSEWRRWIVESKAANHTKATVKHYDKLMTLSNSTDFTQDMRSVVYDFVLGNKVNGENYSGGAAFAEENDGILGEIIPKISRAKDNSKFYLYNDTLGRVYYVDSTGLHIVQIDGYSYFKDGSVKVDGKAIKGLSEDKNQIDSETLTELNAFKKYNALTAEEKVNELQTNIVNSDGGTYKKLNTTIVNPYLKYLTNSSMLKGVSGSASSFDIMSEVKDWAQISSSTESASYWMTSVFDYFKTVSTIKDQSEFIKTYVQFQTDGENKQNEAIEKTEKWFYSSVETKQSLNAINPSIFYTESFDKWTEEIRTKTDASNYPKQEIIIDGENGYREKLVQETNQRFWMPKDIDENNAISYNYVYSKQAKSYIVLNFGQITSEIQNSYITFKNGGTK